MLSWSTLASGFLTGKYRRNQDDPTDARRNDFDSSPVDKEEGYDVVEMMNNIAKNKGVSILQIALAGLLHQPEVTAPTIRR